MATVTGPRSPARHRADVCGAGAAAAAGDLLTGRRRPPCAARSSATGAAGPLSPEEHATVLALLHAPRFRSLPTRRTKGRQRVYDVYDMVNLLVSKEGTPR